MGWNPAVAADEAVLVACNLEARRRVPFHCLLTDKRLILGRPTVWAVDGLVTDSFAISDLQQVELKRLRPFALWMFGALAAFAFVLAVYGMFTDSAFHLGWYGGVLLLAAAAISFGGARNRWVLRFHAGKKRRKLVTPVGSHQGVRNQMAEALREIDRLLRDANARTLMARDILVERDSEEDPAEDRDLCPDGNCTGLIGPDGKCKLCGASYAAI
jgi:hypothetical protein